MALAAAQHLGELPTELGRSMLAREVCGHAQGASSAFDVIALQLDVSYRPITGREIWRSCTAYSSIAKRCNAGTGLAQS